MNIKRLPKWLPYMAMCIAAANFVASIWVFSKLGGDTSYGYEAGGHYFLSFGHGTFIEVSHATFEFAWWYGNSVPAMMVLALILVFVVGYQHRPRDDA